MKDCFFDETFRSFNWKKSRMIRWVQLTRSNEMNTQQTSTRYSWPQRKTFSCSNENDSNRTCSNTSRVSLIARLSSSCCVKTPNSFGSSIFTGSLDKLRMNIASTLGNSWIFSKWSFCVDVVTKNICSLEFDNSWKQVVKLVKVTTLSLIVLNDPTRLVECCSSDSSNTKWTLSWFIFRRGLIRVVAVLLVRIGANVFLVCEGSIRGVKRGVFIGLEDRISVIFWRKFWLCLSLVKIKKNVSNQTSNEKFSYKLRRLLGFLLALTCITGSIDRTLFPFSAAVCPLLFFLPFEIWNKTKTNFPWEFDLFVRWSLVHFSKHLQKRIFQSSVKYLFAKTSHSSI